MFASAGFFQHRQAVHVGAHHHQRTRTVLHDRDHAGAADAFGDLKAGSAQFGGEARGGLGLHERQLGIAVKVIEQRAEVALVIFGDGIRQFGIGRVDQLQRQRCEEYGDQSFHQFSCDVRGQRVWIANLARPIQLPWLPACNLYHMTKEIGHFIRVQRGSRPSTKNGTGQRTRILNDLPFSQSNDSLPDGVGPTQNRSGLFEMASTPKWKFALVAIVASIGACANVIQKSPAPQQSELKQLTDNAFASSPSTMCDRASPITIDTYKLGVARHILRFNLGHTFDGRLPPMLPAVVVLRLSIDRAGTLTDVLVQRSRDKLASEMALASIRRSGNFPVPCGLILEKLGTVTFSETFLFNGQYQFQLRSVADYQ